MTRRPSAYQRGYDDRWRRARADYLRAHPWCVLCAERGRRTRATVVDHITPHRGNQRLFWSRQNWQPLCATCHNGTKQSEERTGRRRGWDASGLPLDPRHPWRTDE